MIAEPDPAAPGPQSQIAGWLAKRLPTQGPLLALGEAASRLAPRRGEVERRSWSDDPSAAAAVAATTTAVAGAWSAIVLDAAIAATPCWPGVLGLLRRALDTGGRLFVVFDAAALDSHAARWRPICSEVVAALGEAAFSIVHEEIAADDSVTDDSAALRERGSSDGARTRQPAARQPALLALEARADPYLIRSYRDGDETAILRLFADSFSPARGLDHWRWKYRDQPFGAHTISIAFAPDGELVAHYAAYPVRFRRGRDGAGETVLCHQVGDTMTDRRHRHVGRGPTSLLGRTARHFYARRCEGKVAFNYGFNTGNIQRFSQLFVGARKVWDLELWSVGAGELRLAPERRFRPYRASRVDRVDADFDRLFEQVAPRYGLLVERRAPWLEWRYLRCPDVAYQLYRVDRGGRLVGWGVARAGDQRRLLLGDALIDPDHPEAASALLRAMVADGAASSESEPSIEAWFSRHPAWWTAMLEALGFVAGPEPRDLGMVFVPFLECPEEELRTGYYLTMGDSDLF